MSGSKVGSDDNVKSRIQNMQGWIFGISLLLTLFLAGSCLAAKTRPNIIIVYTDDHGYADIGVNGMVDDIRTPNIDYLATHGVRMTEGYVTAPQCAPSRAGLLTGRYQERFGLDSNGLGPLPKTETTIAQRLKRAGYKTGMVGKWHLAPEWHRDRNWISRNSKAFGPFTPPIPDNFEAFSLSYSPKEFGFTEYFWGLHNTYRANYDLNGNDLPEEQVLAIKEYRVDTQSEAALTFIDRNHKDPFFLYLAYYAPHVPVEATRKYLDRFPGDMPTRRRYALAMISAMDDGVGRILEKLRHYGIEENTLVFFISDNGAPTHLHKEDKPLSVPLDAWDGSLNDPWVGEKGMLTDGGIRVPYIVYWPGSLPAGLVYRKPVLSLDATATALAVAGIETTDALDGVDLMPYLIGGDDSAPHEDLFWRFWNQAAMRSGRWKYIYLPDGRTYLFDMASAEHEHENRIARYPEIAASLHRKLEAWCAQQKKPGLPAGPINRQEKIGFSHYLGD